MQAQRQIQRHEQYQAFKQTFNQVICERCDLDSSKQLNDVELCNIYEKMERWQKFGIFRQIADMIGATRDTVKYLYHNNLRKALYSEQITSDMKK